MRKGAADRNPPPIIRQLKEERQRRGWTQGAVAAMIGVGISQSNISRWELWKNSPNLDTTIAWAQALGMAVASFPVAEKPEE